MATTWTKLEAMSTRRSTGTGVGLGEAAGADVITGVGEAVGLTVGFTVGEGVGVGVGETVGDGEGVGVGVGVVLLGRMFHCILDSLLLKLRL